MDKKTGNHEPTAENAAALTAVSYSGHKTKESIGLTA